MISKRRTLQGKLELSELSFGASSLGGLYRAVTDEDAVNVLEAAWKSGIRYFDTAPFYGFGLSECRLGRFLADRKAADFMLSTKVGRLLEPVANKADIPKSDFVNPLPNRPVYDYSYSGIMRSFEQSKERLCHVPIDIAFIHDIGTLTHGKDGNEQHYRDLVEGGYRALDELKRNGDIKAIGLGVNEVKVCLRSMADLDIDLILLAGRYTLLDRTAEHGLLAACERHGTELIIGGVFNSGILATGDVEGAYFDYALAPDHVRQMVRQLETVCHEFNVKLAHAAIRFPLKSRQVSSVLIGTGKAQSIQKSVDAFDASIPDAFWDACDEIVGGWGSQA
ncbi:MULTISPECIES: aldo/keto reductase [Thalassospira]|uniref:Aldo/keto reductase n=1 Tax=Thalassospira aquimaris TaxID=3037796 RepID=A0ABT6G7F9_9PROT|nr:MULTISPECIES: aldo/keto reductase [Thalassospira]MDG4717827.1 aldo/keto reductase [Thalassospira sp. FZY0004]